MRASLLSRIRDAYKPVIGPCPVDTQPHGPCIRLPLKLRGLVRLHVELQEHSRVIVADNLRCDGTAWFNSTQHSQAVLTLIEDHIRTMLGFSGNVRIELSRDWSFGYDIADGPLVEAAQRMVASRQRSGETTRGHLRELALGYAKESGLAKVSATPDYDAAAAVVLIEAFKLAQQESSVTLGEALQQLPHPEPLPPLTLQGHPPRHAPLES